MNEVWNIEFSQQAVQEGCCGSGIPMPLEEHALHDTVFVDRSSEPVSNTIDTRIHLVEKPPGTPSGFPVAQGFSENRSGLDAPFAERLMADFDAALVEQFLHVSVTQGKAVVEPLWAC